MTDYSECAFCNQPIDYCQGHGSDQYAVRTQSDGQLTQPIEFYSTDTEAFERMDALVLVVGPDTHVDVFDQAGDVLAAEYVGMESY